MDANLAALTASSLFAGIAAESIGKMYDCLSMHQRRYPKDAYIFSADTPATQIGVVVSGSVNIISEDYWGNRSILTQVRTGGVFGEAFTCAHVQKLPVSVVAVQPSTIVFLDYRKITTTCQNACGFHTTLIQNMLRLLAEKNLLLTEKISHLTRRTTREKLLSYLSEQAADAGSNSFSIPFNRQELADYLSVDRSAMSAELSRLKADGVLDYHRNQFRLL